MSRTAGDTNDFLGSILGRDKVHDANTRLLNDDSRSSAVNGNTTSRAPPNVRVTKLNVISRIALFFIGIGITVAGVAGAAIFYWRLDYLIALWPLAYWLPSVVFAACLIGGPLSVVATCSKHSAAVAIASGCFVVLLLCGLAGLGFIAVVDEGLFYKQQIAKNWNKAAAKHPGKVCEFQERFQCSGWETTCAEYFPPTPVPVPVLPSASSSSSTPSGSASRTAAPHNHGLIATARVEDGKSEAHAKSSAAHPHPVGHSSSGSGTTAPQQAVSGVSSSSAAAPETPTPTAPPATYTCVPCNGDSFVKTPAPMSWPTSGSGAGSSGANSASNTGGGRHGRREPDPNVGTPSPAVNATECASAVEKEAKHWTPFVVVGAVGYLVLMVVILVFLWNVRVKATYAGPSEW